MDPQEDIEHRLEKIISIVILSRTSVLDTEYIWKSLKEGKYAQYEKLLARLLQGQWYYSIIETNKLLEDNGAYSLKKVKNLIVNNYNKLSWENTQPLNEINKHFDEFYSDKRIGAIAKEIKIARDKHYAHSDLVSPEFKATSEEVKYLLERTFVLLNFISENLFGYQQFFDLSENDLQHILFNKLNEGKQ